MGTKKHCYEGDQLAGGYNPHGDEDLIAGMKRACLPEVFTMCGAKLLGGCPWHQPGGKLVLLGSLPHLCRLNPLPRRVDGLSQVQVQRPGGSPVWRTLDCQSAPSLASVPPPQLLLPCRCS